LAFAKESIPGPNASSGHSHEDLPFARRWLRHVIDPDHVGRTEFMNACCFHLFTARRSSSALTGNSVQVAKRSAPPAAEKTEKSRGAFSPRVTAIVTPKRIRRTPLSRAAVRVCHPITRQRPNKPSALVEMMARAGIKPSGKNQLSFPVYVTNRAKVPQDTLGRPKAPHNPNRSATAERKDRPRARRKNSEVSPLSRSIMSLDGWRMLTSPPSGPVWARSLLSPARSHGAAAIGYTRDVVAQRAAGK